MMECVRTIRLRLGYGLFLPLVLLVALLIPQISYAFFSLSTSYTVGAAPRFVFVADLNNDGYPDLATANYANGNVSVLLNRGNGLYASAVNYAVGSNPSSVFAADLDGDGDQDLAAANFSSDNVSILLNNGNGTFATRVNYVSGDGAWSVYARDLDGDTDLDLAVTNSNAATVSVLRNNGNGTFATKVNYAVLDVPASVHAIDFDGDGDQDLAVADYFYASISILLNNGNGTFAAAVHYEVGNWSISDWVYPIALYAADLDGDGDSDIATANYDNNNVSVLLNNGSGVFGASVQYAVQTHPPSVIAADIDNDGDLDLATANYDSGTVSVLSNNGNGTFAAAVSYPAGSGPWSVFAANLDSDGDLDLAVANYASSKVSILLSDVFVPSPSTIPPNIHVKSEASPGSLPDGPGPVTYTYTVTNSGQVTLTRVTISDNACSEVVFISGDTNNNNWLETHEEWVYRCTTALAKTTIHFSTARGEAHGLLASDVAVGEVFVGQAIVLPSTQLTTPTPSSLPYGGSFVTKMTFSTGVASGDTNGKTAIDPSEVLVIVADSSEAEAASPYSVSDALAASPTINIDRGLVHPVGGLSVQCVSGELVRLADDKNSATKPETAVYYCGEDGKRYVFPNSAIYFSWYRDFSGMSTVSAKTLASIPLGGNATYRPGSKMIKISSDPKIYAVTKGGILRWVTSEEVARTLYGPGWNKMVDDVSESFFTNYRIGPSITLAEAMPGIFAPVTTSCTSAATFTQFLTLESVDSDVRPLQVLLHCLGYLSSDVAPTGMFGPLTESAIKKFQTANGIEPVGYVGPATRDALNRY